MKHFFKGFILLIFVFISAAQAQFNNFKAFEGTFVGAWNNTTFGSTGASTLTIAVNEDLMTLAMTLDLDGNVFGGTDPAPVVLNGPFTDNGFNVSGNSPQLGDIQLTGDNQGNLNGSFTNIPGGFIDRQDVVGTYSLLAVNMNYTIYFTGGGGNPGAVGTINMTKQNPVTDPTNLTANVINNSSVDLNWNDNSGNEVGFRIDRRVAITGTWAEIAIVGAGLTTYSDNTVVQGTDYEYRLAGYNNDTESDYSNVATASVGFAPVADPTNLTAGSTTPGEVDLSWIDNADNETGYKVERGVTTPASSKSLIIQTDFTEIASLPANSNSYNDDDVTQGVNYTYRVKAFNVSTESNYSNEASVTAAVEPITAPADLLASAVDPAAIYLTWRDESTNETGFTVERKDDQNDWSVITTTEANSNNYQDINLEQNKSFTYRVRAFNTFTVSDYSNESSATTLPVPIEAPTELNAVSNQPGSIDLNWTDNASNEDGYIVERDIVSPMSAKQNLVTLDFSVLETLPANSTSYTDNTAEEGITYKYRIKGFNSFTESNYSNEASALSSISPITAPTNLIAASSPGIVNLTWDDNADNEDGYVVERKTPQTDFTVEATLGPDIQSYEDNNVDQGADYTYRVKAFNSLTESGYSNESNVTVGIIPVQTPTNLAAVSNDPGSVELSWEDNSNNEDGYIVERDVVSPASIKNTEPLLDFTEIATLPANSTSYTDDTPDEGITYKYRVKGFNSLTESDYSNEANVTVITGIDELSALPEEYELSQNYPNPFNPTTTIKYNIPVVALSLPDGLTNSVGQTGPVEGQHVLLKIYNILGTEVATLVNEQQAPGYYSVRFNGNNLASGLYIYRLTAKDFIKTRKMLLVK